MTLLVTLYVTVPLIPPKLPRSNTLLNHIYLPAGMDVLLKLDAIEPLITQFIVEAGLTVTTTFCVLLHPAAVNE